MKYFPVLNDYVISLVTRHENDGLITGRILGRLICQRLVKNDECLIHVVL